MSIECHPKNSLHPFDNEPLTGGYQENLQTGEVNVNLKIGRKAISLKFETCLKHGQTSYKKGKLYNCASPELSYQVIKRTIKI